jgi:hypothetical protein
MNATENRDLCLSLRVDLANAAIAYANRCVEYSLNPSAQGNFDAMMDAEEMMFDLITEARDAIRDLEELISDCDELEEFFS